MKADKRLLALLLSITLCLSTLLSGCSPAEAQEMANELARAGGKALGEYLVKQGQADEFLQEFFGEEPVEASGTGSKEEKSGAKLAERFATEKPWVNSNIYNTVTPEYDPSLKDDFYVAVNKDWFDHAEFRPGYLDASPFSDQDYRLREQVKQIMTDPSMKGEDVEKVQSLYALWLDWDARNSRDYVSEIRSHTDIVHKIQTMEELSDYLTSEESWYYGSNLAGAGLSLDQIDSTRYSIALTATGLTLGDAAEYETLTEEGYLDKEYADAVSLYMLQMIGYSRKDAVAIIAAKYDFERKIAACEMTYADWNDPASVDKTYHPVTLSELSELSPNFPYVELLKTIGYAESEYINLTEPEWLSGLNELYTQENLQGIKAYLIDDIASSYLPYIDEASYRYMQELQMKRYGGDSAAADEDIAYRFVQRQLSPEISRIYVENFVTQEKVEDIELLINEAVEYYEQMLKETDWLTEGTREKAVEKLRAMGIRAVRPEKWIDRSGLKLGTKDEGETLISAVEKIFFFEEDYAKSLINTQVDDSYWMTESVTEVNSYYYASLNEIYIIAGILGDRFYDEEMTIEEKMGAIGSVIGHEISHAFDTNGAQFDKDGNVADWWTKEDYQTFQDRADRLIDYFSTFTVDESGNNYNGFQVQTETIADMAGMKCMLGIAKGIDGFDYDRFFRSYAAMWREITTPEYLASVIKTDTHALGYLRVNAIVQQFDEFYETYDVKEGDGMYLAPEDRVAVW